MIYLNFLKSKYRQIQLMTFYRLQHIFTHTSYQNFPVISNTKPTDKLPFIVRRETPFIGVTLTAPKGLVIFNGCNIDRLAFLLLRTQITTCISHIKNNNKHTHTYTNRKILTAEACNCKIKLLISAISTWPFIIWYGGL